MSGRNIDNWGLSSALAAVRVLPVPSLLLTFLRERKTRSTSYFGSTAASALAINNCANALTYSTSRHIPLAATQRRAQVRLRALQQPASPPAAITASGTVTVTGAVKSDQTTATSTAVAVTPAVQQNHPSAAKAWIFGNGGTTPSVVAGFNIASVSRPSIGLINVTLTTPMTSANYVAVCNAQNLGTNASTATFTTITSSSVFVINHVENSVSADPANFNCIIYGTQ